MASRILLRLIILSALLQMLSLSFCLAQETEFLQGEINEDNVNVRADSTVNARTVCNLNKGALVSVVRESYGWYKIQLPKSGPAYINKDFLLVGGDCGRVLKNNVNIRLEPNTSSAILGKANAGDIVTILSKSADWYKIEPTDNSSGWINKMFVGSLKKKEKALPVIIVQPEEKSKLFAEGVIKPKTFTRVATHKLITAEKVYLLRGNKQTFDSFNGRRVRISAKIIDPSMEKYRLVTVETIEAIKQ
jgi:uncharacterized protein YgiM (DUF1202 family)